MIESEFAVSLRRCHSPSPPGEPHGAGRAICIKALGMNNEEECMAELAHLERALKHRPDAEVKNIERLDRLRAGLADIKRASPGSGLVFGVQAE